MSRRSKETLAVQLFPFLAVLVCTMGSLIFLLLVTTQKIRQRTVAYAAYQLAQQLQRTTVEAPPLRALSLPLPATKVLPVEPVVIIPAPATTRPKSVKLPDNRYALALAERERELGELKASWRQRASQLAKERDQHQALLAKRQMLVDAALQQTTSLQTEVQQLEVQIGTLTGEAAAASMPGTEEADRALIDQQIAALKKRLRAAQAADANSSNDRFQVVPFDPQSGTTRRPIFIECSAAGIRFLPEDILITASDLKGFTNRANPLAAGTGALINYWTAWNLKQREPHSEPEPYVLILVRPDGVLAYYVAMKMLEPIRTSQGYELIEQSTLLQLPEADAGAKVACQAAVNRLLTEREYVSRSAVNSGSGGAIFGGAPRGGRGDGGKRAGSPGGGFAGGSVSGGPADGRGADNGSFTLGDVTGGDRAVGTRSWERVENFEGRPRHRRGDDVARDLDDLSDGMPGGSGRGQAGGSSGRYAAGTSGSMDDGEPQGSNSRNAPAGTGSGTGTTAGAGSESGPGHANGSRGAKSGSLRGGPSGPGGSSSKGGVPSEFAEGFSEPEPGMPIGQRPPGKRGRSKTATGETSDESEDGQETGSDEDGGVEGGTASSGSSRSRDPQNSSTLSDHESSPRRFPRKSPGLSGQPGDKRHKPSDEPDKQLEPEMLAGRRWGQSEPGASIGFEREVRVDVTEDKLVIAEKHVVSVGEDEKKQEIFERFASALDAHSREWGRPPQGFFWTPRLKFVVKPEANSRYEQVNALMTRAGLATSHEFAKPAEPLKFGRDIPATTKSASKSAGSPGMGVIR